MTRTRLLPVIICASLTSAGLLAAPALAADPASCATVRLSDPGWTDITATDGVASALLSGLGYSANIATLSVPIGYEALKNAETDVFLGNWMPAQQKFRDDLDASGKTLHTFGPGLRLDDGLDGGLAVQALEDFARAAIELDHAFRVQQYPGLLYLFPLQAKQACDARARVQVDAGIDLVHGLAPRISISHWLSMMASARAHSTSSLNCRISSARSCSARVWLK